MDLLEEFLKKKAVRPEYVTDPNRIPDEEKRAKIKALQKENLQENIARGSETKVIQKGKDREVEAAPISVDGYHEEAPAAAPVAEEKPKRIPENLIPKDDVTPAYAPKAQAPAAPVAEKKGDFPWDRLLMGATPLLVGLLTGNKLEGVQTAAKQLVGTETDLYKRERDLAGKIEELKAKQQMGGEGGKRRYQRASAKIEDPSAPGGIRNIMVMVDTFTGRVEYPGGAPIDQNIIDVGYAVNPEEYNRRKGVALKTDKQKADYQGTGAYNSPTTGERVILRNGVEVPVAGQNTGKLNVKQQKDMEELRTEFRQNPVVKRVLPVASAAQQLADLLNSGKAVSQAAARTALARMSGEVGNLAAAEQAVYTRSPSINAQIKGWLNLQATDEALQPHEVRDLLQIAGFYVNASKEMLSSATRETREVGVKDYNLPEDTVNRITSPITDPLFEQIEKGEKKAKGPSIVWKGQTKEPENPKQSLPVEIDGQLYWAEPEDWDAVKKQHPNAKRLK